MGGKLAIKRLTASDLTFFEWHFRNHNAGNQKAINLNADVFINELYPALPELSVDSGGKIPIDLAVFGPDGKGLHNLQRKIVKFGTYKNWRLNGEFIYNPDDDPNRYNVMAPSDLALMEFTGVATPSALKLVLISIHAPADQALHAWFSNFLGERKIVSLSNDDLDRAVAESAAGQDHPIRFLTLNAELEDLALGGSQGRRRLFAHAATRQVNKDEVAKARKTADETGRTGEELVNAHLGRLVEAGILSSFEWTSQTNAVAPYDFKLLTVAGELVLMDVKSTVGEFARPLHFSFNEILQIANGKERYEIYRVYEASMATAKLRVCKDARGMGTAVFGSLSDLPNGVTADGFSVSANLLDFGAETVIEAGDDDEAEGQEL